MNQQSQLGNQTFAEFIIILAEEQKTSYPLKTKKTQCHAFLPLNKKYSIVQTIIGNNLTIVIVAYVCIHVYMYPISSLMAWANRLYHLVPFECNVMFFTCFGYTCNIQCMLTIHNLMVTKILIPNGILFKSPLNMK